MIVNNLKVSITKDDLIKVFKNVDKEYIKILEENNQLKDRINKAIEYINHLLIDEYGVLWDDGTNFLDYEPDCKEKLLDILRGGENNDNTRITNTL